MPLKHNAKSKPKSKSYFGGGDSDSDSHSDSENTSGGAGSDAGSDYDDNENDDEEVDFMNVEEEEAAKKNKKTGVAVALDEDLGEDAVDVEDLEEDLEDEDLEEDDDDDEDEDQYVESDEEDEGVKPSKLQGKKVKAVNVYSNEDDSEGAGDDDGDEDDEDPDENYLQKFNAEINKNYITDFHPECIISNYDEVATLAVVVRDATGMIVDDLHRTLPYLTKYERARILGQRAKQINAGAPAFVKVPEKVIDGYLIAEMELANKTIPFIIRRPLPNGGSEYWRVNDLENIGF